MCYYKGDLEGDDNLSKNFLVKHSIIVTCISNDLKHDAFAVRSFEEKALCVLNINRKTQNLNNYIIKFSDGEACQYEGKNSFSHLSKAINNVSHNFFETLHGKSPLHCLGAVVKTHITMLWSLARLWLRMLMTPTSSVKKKSLNMELRPSAKMINTSKRDI